MGAKLVGWVIQVVCHRKGLHWAYINVLGRCCKPSILYRKASRTTIKTIWLLPISWGICSETAGLPVAWASLFSWKGKGIISFLYPFWHPLWGFLELLSPIFNLRGINRYILRARLLSYMCYARLLPLSWTSTGIYYQNSCLTYFTLSQRPYKVWW